MTGDTIRTTTVTYFSAYSGGAGGGDIGTTESKKNEDPRYTIMVHLVRDGRPKYWTFHCIYCGNKLCELDGDVAYLSDIDNGKPVVNRISCKGKWCGRMWYAFQLG